MLSRNVNKPLRNFITLSFRWGQLIFFSEFPFHIYQFPTSSLVPLLTAPCSKQTFTFWLLNSQLSKKYTSVLNYVLSQNHATEHVSCSRFLPSILFHTLAHSHKQLLEPIRAARWWHSSQGHSSFCQVKHC